MSIIPIPGMKVVGKYGTEGAVWAGKGLGKLFGFGGKGIRFSKPSEMFINDFAIGGQRIAPKNLYRELRKSEVGRETLDAIQDDNIKVLLDYGKKYGLYGQAFGAEKSVIYVNNTQSFQKTAQTIIHDICDRAMKGEKVYCPKCGELLVFYGIESGNHPGVFCINNDFKVLMDFKEKNVIEQLGLDKPKE